MFSHFLRMVTRRVQEFLGVKTAKAAKLLDILLTVYYISYIHATLKVLEFLNSIFWL